MDIFTIILFVLCTVAIISFSVFLKFYSKSQKKETDHLYVWEIQSGEETDRENQSVEFNAIPPLMYDTFDEKIIPPPPDCPEKMKEADFETMLDLCDEYKVDPALVLAVIEVESDFNPNAVSKTKDVGYMQVHTPDYDYYELGVGRQLNLLCPADNLEAGIFELADLQARYGEENTEKIAIAYNCGRYAADRMFRQGIKSTRYSRAVLYLIKHYTSTQRVTG